jgi:hypothetical protein
MSRNLKIMLCLIIVGALMAGSLALAEKPVKPDTDCKWKNLECSTLDWAPVVCKGSLWFENRCFAKRACAVGCRAFLGG